VACRVDNIYVSSSTGGQVPLASIAHVEERPSALAINHLEQFPAATISFNLAARASLGRGGSDRRSGRSARLGMPISSTPHFGGRRVERFALAWATNCCWCSLPSSRCTSCSGCSTRVLSTRSRSSPRCHSAGIGALLSLLLTGNDLKRDRGHRHRAPDRIVKKNAIMMIGLRSRRAAQRGHGTGGSDSPGVLLRLRPILMTTMRRCSGVAADARPPASAPNCAIRSASRWWVVCW